MFWFWESHGFHVQYFMFCFCFFKSTSAIWCVLENTPNCTCSGMTKKTSLAAYLHVCSVLWLYYEPIMVSRFEVWPTQTIWLGSESEHTWSTVATLLKTFPRMDVWHIHFNSRNLGLAVFLWYYIADFTCLCSLWLPVVHGWPQFFIAATCPSKGCVCSMRSGA